MATNNSKHHAAVRDGVGAGQEPDGSIFHFFVTISDKDLQGEKKLCCDTSSVHWNSSLQRLLPF